jgi:hypothetical protein
VRLLRVSYCVEIRWNEVFFRASSAQEDSSR